MAGETDTERGIVQDIPIDDPFGDIRDSLATLVKLAQYKPWELDGAEIVYLPASGAIVNQHPKLRVHFLILQSDQGSNNLQVLTVGGSRYEFISGTGPAFVPFPIVVERGVDLAFSESASNGGCYLIGIPE
jgi:hypothetical protein